MQTSEMMEENEKPEEDLREDFKMKKTVGLWSGVAITVGLVVGSGIFVSPIGVLKSVHGNVGLSLVVWVASGLVAMLSALCYCELGASLKVSGGDFTNFHLAYGPAMSFAYTWTKILIQPGDAATLQIFATYLTSPFYADGCTPPESVIKLFAILLWFFINYLNCISVKATVMAEVAFAIAKFTAMFVIAVAGIIHLANGSPVGLHNLGNAFSSESLSLVTAPDVGMALYQGFFTYTGFAALYEICEEMKDVKKNLPRACVLSLVSVILIYILVNIGYVSALTTDEIITSKAVAVTFGNKLLGAFAFIIPLSVCFSTMGNQIGLCHISARIPFAAGRVGQSPQILSMIHTKYYSPTPALALKFFVTLIYILIGDFDTLIQAFVFVNWTFHGLSAGSVLILRRKLPNLQRPYKVPIVIPMLVCIVAVFFIVVPFLQNPSFIYFYAIAFYVLAFIAYYAFMVRKIRIPGTKKATLFLQKLMQVAKTDWEEDDHQKDTKE